MDVWENFFLAQVGASAALTGLIFVSVSINLKKILQYSKLVNRAFQVLAVLLQILVVSSLALVPGQSAAAFGAEVLILGIGVWIIVTAFEFGSVRTTPPEYRNVALLNAGFSQVAALPYVVGGIILMTSGGAGCYWLVGGILLSYAKAIFEAWVLLVEINR
jgi:hypothetical protein